MVYYPSYIMKAQETEQQFLDAYELYSHTLFRHAYYRVFEEETAKDLLHDAYVKCWDYMAKGNEIKNIRALLYRILNNLIIDRSRKKKESSLETLIESGHVPFSSDDALSAERQDAKEVVAVLEQVNPAYRDVIVLRYIDELRISEIAAILGESENAVSVRIHRGLAATKRILLEQ